ncbi:MAG: ABC transporter permease, partial [Ktedonobacteraceae bacterium]
MAKDTLTTPQQQTLEQEPQTTTVSLGRDARQNTLRNIGLIIEHEYKKRLTQRSFIISTIIILVLIVIGACVPTIIQYFTANSNSQTKVVVVNNAGSIAGMNDTTLQHYVDSSLNGTASGQSASGKAQFAVSTASTASSNNLQKQVKDGTLGILLVLDRAPDQDVHFTYYTSSSDTGNTSQVQTLAGQLSLLDRSSRLGLSADQTSKLFAQPAFSVVNLGQTQDKRSVGDIVAGYIIAYAGIILIFMSVYLYGMSVAMGVAEEKGSRIMEILVNAATPLQLMAGKIIGIGAAGLTQMAAFVVVGITALLLQTPLKAALLGGNTGGLNLNITGNV